MHAAVVKSWACVFTCLTRNYAKGNYKKDDCSRMFL